MAPPLKPCAVGKARNPKNNRCEIPKPEWAAAAAAINHAPDPAAAAANYAPPPPPYGVKPPPPQLPLRPSVKPPPPPPPPQIDVAAIEARIARIERASDADFSKLQQQMDAHASSVDTRVARLERSAEADSGRAQQMLDTHIAAVDARASRIERNMETDSAKLQQLESNLQKEIRDVDARHQAVFVEMANAMGQNTEVIAHTQGTMSELDRRTQSLVQTVAGLSDNAAVLARAIEDLRPAAAASLPVVKTPSPKMSVLAPPPPAAKPGFLKRASDRLMRLVGRHKPTTSGTARRPSAVSVVTKSATVRNTSASKLKTPSPVKKKSTTSRRSAKAVVAQHKSATAKAKSMTDSAQEKAKRAKAMAELKLIRKPISPVNVKEPSLVVPMQQPPPPPAEQRPPPPPPAEQRPRAFLNDIAKLKKPDDADQVQPVVVADAVPMQQQFRQVQPDVAADGERRPALPFLNGIVQGTKLNNRAAGPMQQPPPNNAAAAPPAAAPPAAAPLGFQAAIQQQGNRLRPVGERQLKELPPAQKNQNGFNTGLIDRLGERRKAFEPESSFDETSEIAGVSGGDFMNKRRRMFF